MKYVIIIILLVASNVVFSQRPECGADDDLQQAINAYPGLIQIIENARIQKRAYIDSLPQNASLPQNDTLLQKGFGNYKIPIVVHLIGSSVITEFQANNYEKVREQIRILNEDYGKEVGTNGDGAGVDTEIEFCFAMKDPNYQPTYGITHTTGNFPLFDKSSHPNNLDSDYSLKHLKHWPEDEYLNIYVAELALASNGGVLAGYGTFPEKLSVYPDLDGIVVDPDFFGSSNHPTHGAGRTLTHEAGHWLGLMHTFGNYPSTCYEDDGIDDTPVCEGPGYAEHNNSCIPYNTSINQCTTENDAIFSTDRRQVENYMDYSDQLCKNMFTQGQADWMLATVFLERPWVITTLNTQCSYYEHCINGIQDEDETGVDCGGIDCQPCLISGPGNNGINCHQWLNVHGFSINDKNNEVTEVCLQDPITIAANPRSPGCSYPASFEFARSHKIESRIGGCDIANENPTSCSNIIFFRCKCHFAKLFVAVTLCDYNLTPIGQEYSSWMNFNNLSNRTFNLYDYLPSPNISFQSGQTYRVKIATVDGGGWREYTRYIHLYEDNRVINNANITSNIFGKWITINNSTVNAGLVAQESIVINPNSTLLSGVYKIEAVNCGSFYRPSSQGGNGGGINDGEQPNSRLEGMSLFEEEKHIEDSKFNIYPNPTNGIFNVDVGSSENTALIEVYNVVGKQVFNRTISNGELVVNITDQPKGIYFVKVTAGSDIYNSKIIYQ